MLYLITPFKCISMCVVHFTEVFNFSVLIKSESIYSSIQPVESQSNLVTQPT